MKRPLTFVSGRFRFLYVIREVGITEVGIASEFDTS
jgi:hypothetical protein